MTTPMSTKKRKKEKRLFFERSYVYAISFIIAWFKSRLYFFPLFYIITDYIRGVVVSCKLSGNFFQSPRIEWTIESLTLGKA